MPTAAGVRPRGQADRGGTRRNTILLRRSRQWCRATAALQNAAGLRKLRGAAIARVHGMATAAGCQLVASCDLAVAAAEAQFATPGVKIGLFCTTPMVPLVRAVHSKLALEMLFTGAPISAERALAAGLVNRVVPADELDVIQEFCQATWPVVQMCWPWERPHFTTSSRATSKRPTSEPSRSSSTMPCEPTPRKASARFSKNDQRCGERKIRRATDDTGWLLAGTKSLATDGHR